MPCLSLLILVSCGNGTSLVSSPSSEINSSKIVIKDEAIGKYLEVARDFDKGDYYLKCFGEVSAKVLFINYKQIISSSKLKKGNELYFETFTTSTLVSKAEQRYENRTDEIYGYLGSTQNVSNSGDAESGYSGTATWKDDYNVQNKSEYIETFGHSLFSLTNYDINEDNIDQTILSTNKTSDTNGNTVYEFTVSVTDTETTIDATKGYGIEMDHMSGFGIPTFKEAFFALVFSKYNDELININIKETYTMKMMGINTTCTSWMTNKVVKIDDESEIPQSLNNNYKNTINKIKNKVEQF